MSITLKKRTPRTDAHTDALIAIFAPVLDDIAEKMDIPVGIADRHVMRYITLCARVDFGDHLFPATLPTDSADEALARLDEYLDSPDVDRYDRAITKLARLDEPKSDTSTGE